MDTRVVEVILLRMTMDSRATEAKLLGSAVDTRAATDHCWLICQKTGKTMHIASSHSLTMVFKLRILSNQQAKTWSIFSHHHEWQEKLKQQMFDIFALKGLKLLNDCYNSRQLIFIWSMINHWWRLSDFSYLENVKGDTFQMGLIN